MRPSSGAVRAGGDAAGRGRRRGVRRDRRRREDEARRIHTFTIYESSLGVGGTWWDNTYPGAEVDVGSHLYSFSFKSHDWTRTHAGQAELQKYLEETVDEFGLRPHLRLGVEVESATWDDDRHVWTVQLDDGTGPTGPTSATCSSAASASSTFLATRTGRGSTTSQARSSTPRGGSTSTT